MKGKAIYTPTGKAGEYAKYACNFYTGCSNGCTYCYLKKGIGKKVLGGDVPTLKKCFRNEEHAIRVYFDELYDKTTEQPKADIKEHGVFFTFSSDPCLPETAPLNFAVINQTLSLGVPVKMLTKCTAWIDTEQGANLLANPMAKYRLAVGFTLTGRDDYEPKAAPNAERIKAMKRIHDMGILTFASVEPIIDIATSTKVILDTLGFCDLYKIGLMSGKRDYNKAELRSFIDGVDVLIWNAGAKVYWKNSIRKFVGEDYFCFMLAIVDNDYNIFPNSYMSATENSVRELNNILERINRHNEEMK